MSNTLYGEPIDLDRPPVVERSAGWYTPIERSDLTPEEKAENTRRAYLAAERQAFTR